MYHSRINATWVVGLLSLFAGVFGGAAYAAEVVEPALAGTQWRLVEFQSANDSQGIMRPRAGTLYSMRLHGDGSVSMQLNCNRATGTWSAMPSGQSSSGQFAFTALAATRAHCTPPSLDAGIVAQASFIRSYLLKDGRLYLSLVADGGSYVWEREVAAGSDDLAAAPEQGGPRNWIAIRAVNLHEQPTASARSLARVTPGTVLDNLDCQRVQGRAWCDVQPLGGGPRGYVSVEFLQAAISPDGSVAMGPDDSALRAGQAQFDATGFLPCASAVGQPMGQCAFGVARAGGGYATVIIQKPDRRSRAIFFRMGRPIGADVSEAEGPHDFQSSKDGDLSFIRVGNERYEIPDAVVFGG